MVCNFSKIWLASYIISSVYLKMSKQILVKYFEESELPKEPIQATEGSAGYDLFEAESITILPPSCDTVSLDLRLVIPKGFYGKIYLRSSILKKTFAYCWCRFSWFWL